MQRIYNTNIRVVWSETKRQRNRIEHGLDFADSSHEIRIISFRKATTREAAIFFEGFQK